MLHRSLRTRVQGVSGLNPRSNFLGFAFNLNPKKTPTSYQNQIPASNDHKGFMKVYFGVLVNPKPCAGPSKVFFLDMFIHFIFRTSTMQPQQNVQKEFK